MAKIGQPLALLALYLANPIEILRHINTQVLNMFRKRMVKRSIAIRPLLMEILSQLGGWLVVGYWIGGHLTHKT